MLRPLVVAALAALSLAAPARADGNCYEDIGCPDKRLVSRSELMAHGCEGLRHFRNSIYQANGYCFRDAALAQQYNGGTGKNCRHNDQAAVPLNRFERANVATILSVERAKSCR